MVFPTDLGGPCGCEFEEGSWTVCAHHRLPEVGDILEDENGWRQVVKLIANDDDYGFWTINREGEEYWTDVLPPWRRA